MKTSILKKVSRRQHKHEKLPSMQRVNTTPVVCFITDNWAESNHYMGLQVRGTSKHLLLSLETPNDF